jgi:hypothetical protein
LWPSKEYAQAERSGKELRKKLEDRGLRTADIFLQLDPDFVRMRSTSRMRLDGSTRGIASSRRSTTPRLLGHRT